MKKFKKWFNCIAASCAFLGIAAGGCIASTTNNFTSREASATFSTYNELTNNLPEFLQATYNGTTEWGQNINEIFLVNPSHSLDIRIATQQDAGLIVDNPPALPETKYNPTYYSQAIVDEEGNAIPLTDYYYFDFASISLYYNLSNSQIESGAEGTNILDEQQTKNFITDGEYAINAIARTPKALNISFKLNTANANVTYGTGNPGDDPKSTVILNKEGVYTLALPTLVFHTENAGTSYTPTETTIYYTFMVFNSDTYFNTTSGLQNVTMSNNLQSTVIASSADYSRFYFFNYAYAHEANTLPTLTYNQQNFRISIKWTDIDNNTNNLHIEYQNDELICLGDDGSVLEGDAKFIDVRKNAQGLAKITFTDLGEYDISYEYLYVMNNDDGTSTTYTLPLENNLTDSSFLNKSQKLYMYGYQATYSDYADRDPNTNQPKDKEFKTSDFEQSKYDKTADITSAVNNYIYKNSLTGVEGIGNQNPSKVGNYEISTLKNHITTYLKDNSSGSYPTPVSSNQPPIKFLKNANVSLKPGHSKIYSVEKAGTGDVSLTSAETFNGLNQNDPGTYVYIAQYTYGDFMSQSGILQGEYYHYQIFYFTITNKAPSVTNYAITDNGGVKTLTELYSKNYTNKDVLVVSNAEANEFDAKVSIELTATAHKTGIEIFKQNFDNLTLETVDGKEGFVIETSEPYANAKWEISIKSANDTVPPALSSFYIDTTPISNIEAMLVSKTDSSLYSVQDILNQGVTNQPIAISWDEKDSKAQTYGYLKHIPFSALDYYSGDNVSNLLFQLLQEKIDLLPVSMQIDFEKQSNWSEYANSGSGATTIPATSVRSENGIYILQVYDQAGNNAYAMYMIDKTAPIFIQKTESSDGVSFEILHNSKTISVPTDGNTEIFVHWAQKKGIFFKGSLTDFSGYNLSGIEETFEDVYNNFFSGKIQTVTGISTNSDFDGNYFVSKINDKIYIKERTATFSAQTFTSHSYKIDFIDELKNEAKEGTYKILIRDESNSYNSGDEKTNYINNPSAFVSFNVSSDRSKVDVVKKINGNDESLEIAYFSNVSPLFKDAAGNYTTNTHDAGGTANTKTDATVKNSYRTPINATKDILYLSYIPVLENATLNYVNVKFYEYETKNKLINDNYYFYKDIKATPTINVDVFKYNANENYTIGEEKEFALSFGQGTEPAPGMYVISREYAEGSALDTYDYFKRTITFFVDPNGIISSLENVEGDGKTSLESVVGGDIILNMHSNADQAGISVSFPKYENGLNYGSFFTKNSITESLSVDPSIYTNRLPVSLYVPKYKYTISSIINPVEIKQLDSANANSWAVYNKGEQIGYNLSKTAAEELAKTVSNAALNAPTNSPYITINDALSYYGYVEIIQTDPNNLSSWAIKVEGVVYAENLTKEEAYEKAYNELSIVEYELSGKIEFTGKDGKKEVYNTKSIEDRLYQELNYLTFYNGATQISEFTKAGDYVVTLYQGNKQSSCYRVYKFAFVIESSAPEFNIIGSNGYDLVAPNDDEPNIFYTNSDTLTIQWTDKNDPYMVDVDKTAIIIKHGTQEITVPTITTVGNTNSFTLTDCISQYLLAAESKGAISITLRYEGWESGLYADTTKTIYFDIQAPTTTLNNLMTLTENATNKTFTTAYQKSNTRVYTDYKGSIITNATEIEQGNASYITNVNAGYFRYYSFTVDSKFFNETLINSVKTSTGSELAQVNFTLIGESLKNYNQADQNTRLDSYSTIGKDTTDVSSLIDTTNGGYYEIVECDYAGNRTIYVVYLKAEADNIALEYSNSKHTDPTITITDEQIVDNYNIYSNTGFTIKNLNYNQDSWLYFEITINRSTTKYLASPWLENQVYKISGNGVLTYSPASLENIIPSLLPSSREKKLIVFANRTEGLLENVYLTILDANLIFEKKQTSSENEAVIGIKIPTAEQVNNGNLGYIFPVEIIAEKFDAADGWIDFGNMTQGSFGQWATNNLSQKVQGNELIVTATTETGTKIKFTITDNFGNQSHIIVLAGNSIDENVTVENGHTIYTVEETDGRTYVSDGNITYYYNSSIYKVLDKNGNTFIQDVADGKTGLNKIEFTHTGKYYDSYYKLIVKDADDVDAEPIKTIYIRIYNKLPEIVTAGNIPPVEGGIVFVDKNNDNLVDENFTPYNGSYMSLEKDGKTYTAKVTALTTFSRNVTIRFKNGLKLANNETTGYERGIPYRVYLTNDRGESWINIDDEESEITAYTISGAGTYHILVHYTDEDVLAECYKIYEVVIHSSDSAYYFVTVDGQNVSKATGIKYSFGNKEYEVTYIVALDYNDRGNNRFNIDTNKELEVVRTKLSYQYQDSGLEHYPANSHEIINANDPDVPRGTIVTEIWQFSCGEARGEFAVIFIPLSNNIVGSLAYESAIGDTVSLKNGTAQLIAVDKDTASNFNKLKIKYSSHYGVVQNQIKLEIYKQFNGNYVRINTPVYKESDELMYTYIEMAGSYRIKAVDSCTPANYQLFNGKYDYVDVTFLSSVPFEVITQDDEGNEVVTSPIQRAIYNSDVTLRLANFSTYYSPSVEFKIIATKNGAPHKVSSSNNSYTFSDPGFYTVYFEATSTTGVALREETYSFTIINKNESRYAFEFSSYKDYYIEKIFKNNIDVTDDFVKYGNFKTIVINNKPYLASITLNHLDEKTGSGKYKIFININNPGYKSVLGEGFEFDLWINMERPPINVSVAEGDSTTDPISISFNVQNLYNAVGDCYIKIGSFRKDYTSENISSYPDMDTITITGSGTYFVQVFTQSGHLLYSYKVTKTEPLNSFAIIAIIIGVIAVGAIIFITIKLRKRQKVK